MKLTNIFRAKSKMKKALSGVFVVVLAACLLIITLNTPAVNQALRKIGGNERKETQTEETEEPSEQPSEIEQPSKVEQPSEVEEFGTEIIPEGCEYYSVKTNKKYIAGEKFLKTLSYGDKLCTTEYIYEYIGDGWSVKVRNRNKREYEELLSTIAGESLVSMEETFYECRSLVTVPEIPDTVTNMYYTFFNCSSLVTVPEIPESVINMCGTFEKCSSLATVPEIPDTVKNMYYTFCCCYNLVTAPEIPDTVANMKGTFYGCSSLVTAPVIPDSVTDMSETFYGCSSLVAAPIIPDTVTNMKSTFSGCSSLVTAPVIPDSVTDMSETFHDCYNLVTAPEIPSGVTDMCGTFSGCKNLTGTVIINANPNDYTSCFEYILLEKQNIILSGDSSKLEDLKATADSEEKRMVRIFDRYRLDGITCDYDEYHNYDSEIGQYINNKFSCYYGHYKINCCKNLDELIAHWKKYFSEEVLNEFSPIYKPENNVFIYDGVLYMAPMREGDYNYFDYNSISIISSNDNEIIFKINEFYMDTFSAEYTFTIIKNGDDYIIAEVTTNNP